MDLVPRHPPGPAAPLPRQPAFPGQFAFPPQFTWGVASSAYQVEGSPLADGASPSTWHEFCRQPGRIRDGATGDVACDHYHRWPEDVATMRSLGLKAYRFSVAWPRIVPEAGRGNEAGLDFYRRLVDGLLAAGIEPWVTLFHWETPMWLERLGGLTARSSVDHFQFHVEAVVRALGDRVRHWITVNEPLDYSALGYVLGMFPPGRVRDLRGMYHSSHHLLLAHGRAVDVIRALAPGSSVGIALPLVWISPLREGSRFDRGAARFMDGVYSRFYLDAVLRASYPADVLPRTRRYLPRGWERDLPAIGRPIDFLGVNYYAREVYRWAPLSPIIRAKEVRPPDAPRSPMWEIWAPGLYRHLARLRDEYGNPPVVITENGFPTVESPGVDPLADHDRIRYLRDHVSAMAQAMVDGCDCRGYFHWSLVDNFEWQYGFTMRFGLLRTDFSTQERRWRASASWFKELASCGRLPREAGD